MADNTPSYRQLPHMELIIYPEVVVLPSTTEETTGTNSNDGSIDTNTKFNCNTINLKKGSTGDDVKKLQTILKAKGYYTRRIDGDFGIYTFYAVQKLQRVQGNTPDGWFGAKTCRKLQGESITSNIATKTEGKLSKPYTITDFDTTPTLSFDREGVSNEVSLKTTFTQDKFNHLRKLQKTEFTLYKSSTMIKKHKGYINEVKTGQDNGRYVIELRLVGYLEFLNQAVTFEEKTGKRSELLKEIIKLAGLKPDVNFNGLPDDEFTLKVQQESSSESSNGSNGSKTVSECFDMASNFIYPDKKHGGGYGTSTHDPPTAWDAYQKGTRVFDCFGCSAFLYYTISNFAKKPVRVIHRYSKLASSGTHYTVQLKDGSGNWYDPKDEYRKLTTMLRVNSGAIVQVHQVYEG